MPFNAKEVTFELKNRQLILPKNGKHDTYLTLHVQDNARVNNILERKLQEAVRKAS